jgi:alpha,alpha-trehalase
MKSDPNIRFKLDEFVTGNFDLPKAPQLNYITKEKDVVMHIKNLWNVLRRDADSAINGSSLFALAQPLYCSWGKIRRDLLLGFLLHHAWIKRKWKRDMIENMVKNFAYLINTYGHIPNGNRSYYISRSQPPFFSLMVELLASIKGDKVCLTYLPAMEKEYEFWMEGADKLKIGDAHRRVVKLKDGTILNRYWMMQLLQGQKDLKKT